MHENDDDRTIMPGFWRGDVWCPAYWGTPAMLETLESARVRLLECELALMAGVARDAARFEATAQRANLRRNIVVRLALLTAPGKGSQIVGVRDNPITREHVPVVQGTGRSDWIAYRDANAGVRLLDVMRRDWIPTVAHTGRDWIGQSTGEGRLMRLRIDLAHAERGMFDAVRAGIETGGRGSIAPVAYEAGISAHAARQATRRTDATGWLVPWKDDAVARADVGEA